MERQNVTAKKKAAVEIKDEERITVSTISTQIYRLVKKACNGEMRTH